MLGSFRRHPQLMFEDLFGLDFVNMARWYLLHLLLFGVSKGDFQHLTRFKLLEDYEKVMADILGEHFVQKQFTTYCRLLKKEVCPYRLSPVPPHSVVVDKNDPHENVVQVQV